MKSANNPPELIRQIKNLRTPLFLAPVFEQKPLEILYGTEGFLRRRVVQTMYPLLPPEVAADLQDTSLLAEESLQELATINVEEVSDRELQSPRILISLTFIGFSALLISFLLLYLSTTNPHLSLKQQIADYWYQYIFSVCLGVTGLLLFGREVMRQDQNQDLEDI